MKKLMFVLALAFSTSVVFTSCRDDRSGVEKAADDIEDAVDDIGDDLD
ncbi:MAG TPA: hypothetical protein VLN72_01665 [Gillisia sp.]|nr:hypothetical protein [Gillisia sp.]